MDRSRSLVLMAFVLTTVYHSVFGQQPTQTPVDWTQEQASVAKGKVQPFVIDDKQYGRKRKLWVYTPPGYGVGRSEKADLIVSFDGEDYIKDMSMPVILDNLIAAKAIDPVVQVFVDNSDDRLGDLANRQKFADFIALDLLPWARSNYRVTADSARTVLCGYSAGGLAAAYVAFRYPALFGNVLSQSGAFWRGNEGASSPSEWLTDQYAGSPATKTKFYLVVGGAENVKNASGRSMIETNARLRDVLKAKGATLRYFESPGGQHAPEYWRTQIADGVTYLLPRQTK